MTDKARDDFQSILLDFWARNIDAKVALERLEVAAKEKYEPKCGRIAELEIALSNLIDKAEGEICYHENAHRGGAIWTICDDCDMKWADDEGGFQKHTEWREITRARTLITTTHPEGACK